MIATAWPVRSDRSPMSARTRFSIYTLGHSRHAIEHFIAMLKRFGIERVVDVRGQPYSRHNPQYNREPFHQALRQQGIDYLWAGMHLSGRPRRSNLYGPRGEVLWAKIREDPDFIAALDSVAADAKRLALCLVCAEEDPGRCHRRFLLTPPLTKRGFVVRHIRGDGRIEPESQADGEGQQELFTGDG